MTRIEYAFAISGATLIRLENEQDRVCLTRTIAEPSPKIDYGTDWIAAHNIITSTCEIRHAHTALAEGKRKGSFLLAIQRLERAETRNTSKPKSYGEYDGTTVTRQDMQDEYPMSDDEITQQWEGFRGRRGYTPHRTLIDDASADNILHNSSYRPEIYS